MTDNKPISQVAIIGTGVIGASWAALFLAKGLDVVATDIAPNAEASLRRFVNAAWPALERLGLAPRRFCQCGWPLPPTCRTRSRVSISSRRTDPSGSTSRRSSTVSSTNCCRPM